MATKRFSFSTKKESQMLSRYIGFFYSRIITCILLLLCSFQLAPASVYLALLMFFLPLVMQAVFQNVTDTELTWHLTDTLKKYRFRFTAYRAEKNASPVYLLFLAGWQYVLFQADSPRFWRIVPGAILIINVLLRIGITYSFRLYLHYQFTHFKTLEK